MTRKRYVFRDGKFVELKSARDVRARTQIIQDSMPETWNPADGKKYDSRSRYYQTLKAKGCHIIEKGEEVAPRQEDNTLKADLIEAAKRMGVL